MVMKFLISTLITLVSLSGFASTLEIHTKDSVICSNDSTLLIGSRGFKNYTWNTGAKTSSIWATKGGWYRLEAQDSSGKWQYDSIYITQHKTRSLSITSKPSPAVVCIGDTVKLEASSGFKSYYWNTGHRTSSIRLVVYKDMKLLVEAKDSNGCVAREDIKVEAVQCDSCDLLPYDSIDICGDSVLLRAKMGYKSYKWSTGSTHYTATVDSSGWVYVSTVDYYGHKCEDSIYVNLKGRANLTIHSKPSSRIICEGESITLWIDSSFTRPLWTTADTSHKIELKPRYSTKLAVKALDSNGCVHVAYAAILVKDCDSCNLLYHDSISKCGVDSIPLEAKSGWSRYVWSDGTKGRINWVKRSGWYTVTASDSSGNKCTDSVYVEIKAGTKLSLRSNPSSAVICRGDSIAISANSGFKYYWWNTGHRTQRIVIKPLYTKKIVVEAVDSNGCESRAELLVTVKDCDSCNLIYHDSISKCGVDSIPLEAKYGWSHYLWSNGTKGRINWVKRTGWYYVTATDAAGNRCKDSVYVEIKRGTKLTLRSNPSPAIICQGDSIVIAANSGFRAYWWNTGHRTQRVVLKLSYSKKIVVEAVDSNGCESRAELYVTVKNCDTCNLLEHDTISKCDKDSIALEAKSGYYHYLWSDSTKGRVKWVDSTGWYYVSATDGRGNKCTDSVYVKINRAKELKVTTNPSSKKICIGDSIVIEVNSGFKYYYWNTGHRGTRAVLTPKHSTKVVIEAIDSNGCEQRKVVEITVDSCTAGIDDLTPSDAYLVYPNPTEGLAYVKITDNRLIGESLAVYDLNGQLVREQVIEGVEMRLELHDLAEGMYIIQIGSFHTKLILE